MSDDQATAPVGRQVCCLRQVAKASKRAGGAVKALAGHSTQLSMDIDYILF
jgi:hypothetical protein